MNIKSEFKENETFEKILRNTYPKQICDTIIDWTNNALKYIFKKSDINGKFIKGRVNWITKEIEYSNDLCSFEDIIIKVINEMELALDDNDNKENIEKELKMLYEIL